MTLEELQTRVLAALGPNPEATLLKQLFRHVRREIWEETITSAKQDILSSFSERLSFLRKQLEEEEAMLAQRRAKVQNELWNPTFKKDELKRLYNEAGRDIREKMQRQLEGNESYISELKKKVRRRIKKNLTTKFADEVAKFLVEAKETAFVDQVEVVEKIRKRVLGAEARLLRQEARASIIAEYRAEIMDDLEATRQIKREAREAVKAALADELKRTRSVTITKEVERELVAVAAEVMRERLSKIMDSHRHVTEAT
jgi:hypothetical protein